MRRPSLLLALLLVVPAAACGGDDGGDDDAAATTTTTTTEAETETESEADDSSAAGTASPDEYAGAVCGSIATWYGEIDTASRALVDDAGALEQQDPAAGKDLVLAFLDDAIGFTDELVIDLEDAGVPDTDAGARTADRLVAGIEDVRTLFSDARDDTAALPSDDPEALAAGLQDIGTSLQDSATAVSANFAEVLSTVEDPELSDAFESSSACEDLGAAADPAA